MKHRIYTQAHFFEGELALVNSLFSMNLPCLHVRKPNASSKEIANFLEGIDPQYHAKIILHQHPELHQRFYLKGMHLKEGTREKLSDQALLHLIQDCQNQGLEIGTSIHQMKTLANLASPFNYVTLSPIFESISKPNYLPTEAWNIETEAYPFELVALGGIDMHNLLQVKSKGFKSVALLGAIWEDPKMITENYRLLCKKISVIDRMA